MLKPFPIFKTDEEAERFVDEADLSEYDFSDLKLVRFKIAEPLRRAETTVSAELGGRLLDRAGTLGVSLEDYLSDLLAKDLAASQ